MKDWLPWSLLCMASFFLGGGVGALRMKWAQADDLRTLRETARDARKCWETLYVVNKYTGQPRPICEPVTSTSSPRPR